MGDGLIKDGMLTESKKPTLRPNAITEKLNVKA